MRVPLEVVESRRRELAHLIQRQGYMPVKELCKRFGISEATARRDLDALERQQKITRTFGGALVDFNLKFPSFQQRQSENAASKQKVARAALALIRPGDRVFFDAGTTVFLIAELLRDQPVAPLTVVTYSLPVAEVLAAVDSLSVHLLGGQLLQRQSILLGEVTRHALDLWNFDLALLGSRAANEDGIWNAPPEVQQVQREVIRRSTRPVFCLDHTKIGTTGPHFFYPWSKDFELLTDATPAQIKRAGLRIHPSRLLQA